jgi:hypothetical protein
MSNRRTARSNASKLTQSEISRYYDALKARGAMLLRHPGVVRDVLKSPRKIDQALNSLIPSRDPHAEARKQWEAFYLKHFGLTADFSKVSIPSQLEGFTRLIIVAQGVTLNMIMAACKKHFPTWQYADDLDKSITKNDRTATNGAYAVWFRDRIEADEEMANKSANDLVQAGVNAITLLERILMELEYFGRTGQHLDIQNWSLCAGSRNSDGDVPSCRWRDDGFYVSWRNVDYRSPSLRARVAVS